MASHEKHGNGCKWPQLDSSQHSSTGALVTGKLSCRRKHPFLPGTMATSSVLEDTLISLKISAHGTQRCWKDLANLRVGPRSCSHLAPIRALPLLAAPLLLIRSPAARPGSMCLVGFTGLEREC